MNNIKIKILNPNVIKDAEKMMVFCARLTQRGHQIKTEEDLLTLFNSDYKEKTVKIMADLPHPTIQKFGVINIAVIGGSRRFLAQITRHQNEVKFMSASLQYSDYSNNATFYTPREFLQNEDIYKKYQLSCQQALNTYEKLISENNSHDSAGYIMPQALRNILIISATPYQWKHMISQRICHRNTEETRYIMLLIWQELKKYSIMFDNCGSFCLNGECKEGKMSCGKKLLPTPEEILKEEFSWL